MRALTIRRATQTGIAPERWEVLLMQYGNDGRWHKVELIASERAFRRARLCCFEAEDRLGLPSYWNLDTLTSPTPAPIRRGVDYG